MIDKALEEIRLNLEDNPVRWEQIKTCAAKLPAHYKKIIERKRESKDKIIHFAAYVANDAMFGMKEVFSLMMDRPGRWDPKVVIIPDVSRGYAHQKETYLKAKDSFVKSYGEEMVLDGWDIRTDSFIDLCDRFDIIYFADPYDSMAHEVHSIQYASKQNVLPVYVNYGYDVGYLTMRSRMKGPELNLVWKYFTETVYSLEDCKSLQLIKGANVVLTGYAKMDDLASYLPPKEKKRKKLLISSHHTVNMEELPLSCFMSYCELLPTLPDLFPEVDFVFRPHPLLFIRMINDDIWSENQVKGYLEKIKKAGIEYSAGGEYMELFAECDAIINDCGSFTIEWLFTGKPGCFVLNEKIKDEHLTTQMREAIKRYRIARCTEDIISFISDVAGGAVFVNHQTDDWFLENIAINYPHASEKILDELDILK